MQHNFTFKIFDITGTRKAPVARIGAYLTFPCRKHDPGPWGFTCAEAARNLRDVAALLGSGAGGNVESRHLSGEKCKWTVAVEWHVKLTPKQGRELSMATDSVDKQQLRLRSLVPHMAAVDASLWDALVRGMREWSDSRREAKETEKVRMYSNHVRDWAVKTAKSSINYDKRLGEFLAELDGALQVAAVERLMQYDEDIAKTKTEKHPDGRSLSRTEKRAVAKARQLVRAGKLSESLPHLYLG